MPGLSETSTVLGTLVTSVLVYIVTDWARQRSKKSSVLRMIGYVYRPLYYYLQIRAVAITIHMLLLSILFLFAVYVVLLVIELSSGTVSLSLVMVLLSVFVATLVIMAISRGLKRKRGKTLKKLVDEFQGVVPDVDSLLRRWYRVYWELYGLAVRYFLIVLGVTSAVTIILIIADPEFILIGAVILLLSLSTSTLIAVLSHGLLNGELARVLDTETEFEERLFDLIKEPAFCVCVVDSSGNRYCGNLEGISHGISIKQDDDIVVNLPYDLITRAESCPKSRNAFSTPQPFQ